MNVLCKSLNERLSESSLKFSKSCYLRVSINTPISGKLYAIIITFLINYKTFRCTEWMCRILITVLNLFSWKNSHFNLLQLLHNIICANSKSCGARNILMVPIFYPVGKINVKTYSSVLKILHLQMKCLQNIPDSCFFNLAVSLILFSLWLIYIYYH